MSNLLIAAILSGFSFSALPDISIIYPRPDPGETAIYIDNVDSSFIFGSVPAYTDSLAINGFPVDLHPNGAFLAYLPIDWELKLFRFVAWSDSDSSYRELSYDSRPVSGGAAVPDTNLPRLVRLSSRAARTDPRGAYYLFPESGTVALVDEWSLGFLRVPLTAGQSIWVPEYSVAEASAEDEVKPQPVWRISTGVEPPWEEIRLPLANKTLYRVWDETNPDRIFIDLYGVISHIDKIRYSSKLVQVQEIIWEQPEDGLVRLELTLAGPAWGYKAEWVDGEFILRVKQPPKLRRGIKGLRIAIDPGHGGDQFGSIGPTGLAEKDANLEVCLRLAELLNRKGAEVILTRSTDKSLGLYERIETAEQANADFLISLHHNALPDGVNPFGAFGTGTHYYRPQSRRLAQSVHNRIVRELDLPDEGVYYNNLALARPTTLPSILVEAAYIMFPEHEELIMSDDYPARLSRAIYKGIKQFVKQVR